MFSNTIEGNILKYNLYKTFTKRVYLPLITIYLTTLANVTLAQIALIISVTAVVSLVMEIPSGYFADKFGHKKSLLLGSFITAVSPMFYLTHVNFIGGLLGSVLFFLGSAFTQGAIQVFIQETLVELGREKDYVKIMGRAQSFGLIGNVILLALIPLTYEIHHSLPFILGSLCLFIAFFLVLSFKEPEVHLESKPKESFLNNIKNIFNQGLFTKTFLVFLIFGIATAVFSNSTIYRELVFNELGVPVSYFGFILAFGSLLAAITGNYIHHLKKISSTTFYFLDILYVVITLAIISISQNIYIVILAFSLIPMYSRTRNIIFESFIFEEFPDSRYKATLLSVMNFFSQVSGIFIPLVFAFTIGRFGLMKGHLAFGLIILAVMIPVIMAFYLNNKKKK